MKASEPMTTSIHAQHRPQRVLLVLAMLFSLLALGPASDARAQTEVVVTGSGFGHGVGLSQWGAYQRADDGDTYEEILAHYFQGTQLVNYDEASPDHGPLHVNLVYDTTSITLVARDTDTPLEGGGHAPVTVTRGSDTVALTTNEKATISWGSENDCDVDFFDQSGGTIASWPSGSCDMNFVWDGASENPSTAIEIEGCTLTDFGAFENPIKPCRYALGADIHTLDNDSPARSSAGNDNSYDGLDVILSIDIDDYVFGISEIGYDWPVQALRSQAVAARSYAAANLDAKNPLNEKCGCHVYDTSKSQRYVGWGHIGNNRGQPDGIYTQTYWLAASMITDNQVLVHDDALFNGVMYNGVVEAVYSSSNGGASEAANDQWGGPFKEYLSSVDDPQSLESPNPYRAWSCAVDFNTIEKRVLGSGKTLSAIAVTERNTSGSAKTVTFYPTVGEPVRVSSGTMATLVSWDCNPSRTSLPSKYFDVTVGVPPDPDAAFNDIADSVHRSDIEYLAELGVAMACDAGPGSFCPNDRMRREDLAAFMVKALDLPPTELDYFTDDDGLPHEADINSLAEARITRGCNPPANDRFCPDDTVTRGQTAAFIVRAWELRDAGKGNWFTDDDSSVFERDIDRLKVAGVTKGCNPPENDKYCPDRLLTRAEMSSFLARAIRNLVAP